MYVKPESASGETRLHAVIVYAGVTVPPRVTVCVAAVMLRGAACGVMVTAVVADATAWKGATLTPASPSVIEAWMAQVPVGSVTVTSPVEALTVHAVDDPAE